MLQAQHRLREGRRTNRRTVADALEVIRQELGVEDFGQAHIEIGPFQLPSGQSTALVDCVFPDLGYRVSLPTSSRFRGRTSSELRQMETSRLNGSEICRDGSVLIADGTRLRAVEVIPTILPYEPSQLDQRILRHVLALTNAHYCFRSIREDLPQDLWEMVPDIKLLDYSRVRSIEAPLLKLIKGYIEVHDPGLRASNQKIADSLAMYGIRIPVPRRRARGLPQSELDQNC